MRRLKVAIFNDTHGWHSDQLTAAFGSLGIDTVCTDLALCRIDIQSPSGLSIPGFSSHLPDAVLVRGIAPGSLEQITLRMDVLHTLAELGVPVLNPAAAIELTVDKARTSLKLHHAGLNTPATWACENRAQAIEIIQQQLALGYQIVMKPLFGCQGKGIIRIDNLLQLDFITPVGEIFYLQRYIPPQQANAWQDWRLMVVDGEVIAAMSRRASHWITNYAQGAQCFAATVTDEMRTLATAATQAVSSPYAGVDLIQDDTGRFSVLEVNSVPAWKGLYQATGISIAAQIAGMVKRHIHSVGARQFPDHAL